MCCVSDSPQQITLTPDPAVVRLNQSITLTCKADALPPPRYLWKFNGNILSKAVKNNLTLTHAKVEGAGRYTCKAENFYGSKETTRVVNVECKCIYVHYDRELVYGIKPAKIAFLLS